MKYLFCLIVILPQLLTAQPDTSRQAIKRLEWKYNNANYSSLQIDKFTVAPNQYLGKTAGNTGLCINPLTNQIITSLYNYDQSSLIYIFNRSALTPYSAFGKIIPAPTSVINITNVVDYLEGIWFDKSSGLYYSYSTIKGAAKTDYNRIVVCFDSTGKRAKADFFPDFAGQAGMITGRGDRLLIKPQNKAFWKEYSKKDLSLLRTVQAESNEGISTDEITGDIWIGGEDSIRRYDYTTGKAKEAFDNPVKAIEGLAFDGADGTIWMNADKYLHGGTNNGNALYHFDFSKTYKKFVRFPEMIPWSAGTVSGGLVINNNALYGTGYWESPVLDFKNYADYLNNVPTVTQNGSTVICQFRGSNTPPVSRVNAEMPVSYYSSWGTTVPSFYNNKVSAYRYQQIRIVVVCAPPVLSAKITTATCNASGDGSIDISATEGSAPYNFLWSDGRITEDINNLAAGVYTVTAIGSNGCSATASYTVTEPAAASPLITATTVCDSYTWSVNGITYTSSGVYTAVIGCQPYTLQLTVAPSATIEDTASACDSYTWHDTTYTSSGDYTYTSGCSNAILHLTINSSATTEDTASACDSYTWHDTTYTSSGYYTYTSGCSTAILHLTITSSATTEDTASACDSYTWHDTTYTSSGDYTYTSGCSTAILHLTITSSATTEDSASACESYTWYDTTYTSSGDYTYTSGCSTAILHLTITPSAISIDTVSACANSYTWAANGQTYNASGTYTWVSGCHTSVLMLTLHALPVVSVIPGTIKCNGGTTSLTVNATAGQAPYAGTGTITNQIAGLHTYTVIDANGCTGSATLTIIQPSAIIVSAAPGTIACNGSKTSVVISATGGTPPYTGTGTVNNQAAGAHTYIVTDARGCNASATLAISQPAALTMSLVAGKITCIDGSTSVTVSAKGGTGVYTGTGTFSNQDAGSHSYTVTDANGCTASKSISIAAGTLKTPAAPASIQGQFYNLCKGGIFDYNIKAVTGATGYVWTLPAGFAVAAGQGTKSVTVTVPNYFTAQDTIKAAAFNSCGTGIPTALTVYAVTGDFSPYITGPASVKPGQTNVQYSLPYAAGLTYTWTPPAGASITSGQGTNVVKVKFGAASGTIKAIVGNTCGSSEPGKFVSVNASTAGGVSKKPGTERETEGQKTNEKQKTKENKFTLYPNPAHSSVNVVFSSLQKGNRYEIRISKMNGETAAIQSGVTVAGENVIAVDIAKYASAMYLVTLLTGDSKQIQQLEKVD